MFLCSMSKNSWFLSLIILAMLMIIIFWYKKQDLSKYHEGFTQNSPYLFKCGDEANDNFYAEIYNKLMKPDKICSYQIDKIIEMTRPSKESSTFLDIASGTGTIAGKLTEQGYHVYSIDQSKAMNQYVEKKYPKVHTKCGKVEDSIHYDKGSFSHVISNGLALYLFQDKQTFFRNCYFWLKSGGYLILHMVDPSEFNAIVPGGRLPFIENPQDYMKDRITNTQINFIDFKYKGGYDFTNPNKVIFKETFTDGMSKNVREQETFYYMESFDVIMKMASQNGFIPHGQVNLSSCSGDKHQYLVIFERTQ